MDGHSLDLTEERLKALKKLLPEVFSENKIDFQRLREVLGEYTAPPDHYELTWAGKAEARREIQRQTTATLVPDFTESVDFDTSQNVYIEGENLEVLRVLQRSYFGKVKMICIDPPYNTGNDSFVYPDDFAERKAEYEQRTGQTDKNGFLNKLDLFKTNNGQLHSPWLSMMYPRLYMARNLLREDGVIFVSIDDNEAHNLKLLMDEVFGEENFVAKIVWKRKTGAGAKTTGFITLHEYVLVYFKNYETAVDIEIPYSEKTKGMYKGVDEHFKTLGPYATWPLETTSMAERKNLRYPIEHNGIEIWPKKQWLWSKERVLDAQSKNMLVFNYDAKKDVWNIRFKGYLNDTDGNVRRGKPLSFMDGPYSQEGTDDFEKLFNERDIFPFPKPVNFLKQLLNCYVGTSGVDNKNDLILDFFGGSATTAQAVLELNAEDGGNRRFVLVQLPEPTDPQSEAYRVGYESIAAIGRERIRRVIKKMHQAINEADNEAEDIKNRLKTLQQELVELQAAKPELFGVKPSKETQKLTDQIEKLEESLIEAREKAKRLRNAPKDFKAFRLAESNFDNWRSEATTKNQIEKLLLDFKSPQRPDAESQSMLYEFLLKKGYPLTASITREEIDGIAAYIVEKREMWVLLDGYSEAIKRRIFTDKPKHVVCLDKIFAGNDQTLTNLHLDLRDRNIELSII